MGRCRARTNWQRRSDLPATSRDPAHPGQNLLRGCAIVCAGRPTSGSFSQRSAQALLRRETARGEASGGAWCPAYSGPALFARQPHSVIRPARNSEIPNESPDHPRGHHPQIVHQMSKRSSHEAPPAPIRLLKRDRSGAPKPFMQALISRTSTFMEDLKPLVCRCAKSCCGPSCHAAPVEDTAKAANSSHGREAEHGPLHPTGYHARRCLGQGDCCRPRKRSRGGVKLDVSRHLSWTRSYVRSHVDSIEVA